MVVSVSCPTAEIIGILLAYIALATDSSLKGHKSSRDPPPQAIITRSIFLSLFKFVIDSVIELAAFSP